MLPLLSRAAVRAVDHDAVARLGLPSIVLMENAGSLAAAFLRERFPTRLSRVLVVGGVGQNGGDGWVVARHLRVSGETPRCFLVGPRDKVAGDARINLDVLEQLGVKVEPLTALTSLASALQEATLVVDALFGTGLDRPITGFWAEVIACLNAAASPVVALDLPSGVDADTGQVLGEAVRASLTVTFAARKPGLYQFPGAELAGEVRCASIGVPITPSRAGVIEASDVAELLPPRKPDSHKGTNGHVLVVAGSEGKTGAAMLSATAALRMGAGLVTIGSDIETRRALDQKTLEVMTAAIAADDRLSSALEHAQGKAACVIGPGLGLDDDTQAFVRALALALPMPAVLDADALTAFGGRLADLKRAAAARVLTPHPGEAARLLECSTAQIQASRVASARAIAEASGQVVVLKGAHTVIASPSGDLRICASGTPALGSAGTGDVLSGVVGALAAQLPAFEAAVCAVELHARAGELAAISDRGLLAGDLLPALARALEGCRQAAAK